MINNLNKEESQEKVNLCEFNHKAHKAKFTIQNKDGTFTEIEF